MSPRHLLLAALGLGTAAVAAWLIGSGARDRPAPAGARGDSAPAETAPAPSGGTAHLLEGIGYTDTIDEEPEEAGPATGVLHHMAGRPAPGLTLFCMAGQPLAQLVDLEGRQVHTWQLGAGEPEQDWHHVELLPGGELLVLVQYTALERYDWRSRRLQRIELPVHHDLARDARGHVFALVAEPRMLTAGDEQLPLLDDSVVELSPDGEVLRQVWLSDLFAAETSLRRRLTPERLDLIRAWRDEAGERWREEMVAHPSRLHDLFHTNSIQVLERDLPGIAAAGDVLVSVRELSMVAFLDLDPPRLLHAFGDVQLEEQHHATLLPNGHVLVFDNGTRRGWSRVVELDPATGAVASEHGAAPEERFFSRQRGSVQRTAGGGLLVSHSSRGRAFELDASGEMVWDFVAPAGADGERRPVFRFERIAPERARALPFDPPLDAARLGDPGDRR